MPRLLQVTTVPHTLNAFLLPFAKHFRAQGWRVDAMVRGVTGSHDCCEAFDRVWDVSWSRNPLDPRNLLKASRTVQRVVMREGYDIVHVHTPVAGFVARYALKGMPRHNRPRVIYSVHGFHFHEEGRPVTNAVFRTLEKLAGQWTDYLVVINRDDERAARRQRVVPADRIRYMPGIGVDLDRYGAGRASAAESEGIRSSLNLAGDSEILLCIAEFIPRKRHRDVLQGFARMERPSAHLLLAGQGKLMESMKRLAVRLGIRKRVHFLGLRRDIPALLHCSQAVILVSTQEGLPRSVMEALCAEVPVIGTDIRGTRELIDNACGRLVKVGDVDGLSRAMSWLLDHPDEAQVMGVAGRQKMAAFDLGRIIELHESLYNERARASKPFGSRCRQRRRILNNLDSPSWKSVSPAS